MAARIRLFISIKSQSVQIRRCNIRRVGGAAWYLRTLLFNLERGVGSCVFQLNGQKLNFEPEIDCQSEFAYSLLWQIFGSELLPQRWRKCGSTGHQVSSGDRSRPWKKRGLFPGPPKCIIWNGWWCLILGSRMITWQCIPKSARACTWPKSRWTSWQTQGWQWRSSLGVLCLQIWQGSPQS